MRAVDVGVRSRLLASPSLVSKATGGLHRLKAPEDAVPPLLVYQPLFDRPERTLGTPNAWTTCQVQVRGVGVPAGGESGLEVAESLRDLAVEALTARVGGVWSLAVAGYRVLDVSHDTTLTPYSERIGGVDRYHAPAYLTVWIAP